MKWIRRYVSLPMLVVMAFLAFLLFFNEHSVMADMDFARQERELLSRIAMYEDTLMYYEQLNAKLDTDPAELEKIVREHYHMQRPSEDVYLIDK